MGVTVADQKLLWGRAGARCCLCRDSLAAVGASGLLGEMAHIVARRTNGPRGEDPLPESERDKYDNLLLLCPNDHKRIDEVEPTEWSAEKLRLTKLEHENWVNSQLEAGDLGVVEIDSSEFRNDRLESWRSTDPRRPWCYTALTPLEVVEDSLDPLASEAPTLFGSLELPPNLHALLGSTPNRYHIEPSEHGLVVSDFRHLKEGVAYSAEVFRNGHIEYGTTLSTVVRSLSASGAAEFGLLHRPSGLTNHRRTKFSRCIRWDKWALLLISQLKTLQDLWSGIPLPANDMVLSVVVTNIQGATLAVSHSERQWRVGRPLEAEYFEYSLVVSKNDKFEEVTGPVLRRFSNSFGFELQPPFSQGGQPGLPEPLSTS